MNLEFLKQSTKIIEQRLKREEKITMDNEINIKNEVPTVESSTLHIDAEETDVNSVSSPKPNYTKETAKSQTNEEDTLIIEGDYPCQEELQELIDRCNIIRLNGTLHTYKNGIYVADTVLICSKIFKICNNMTPTKATSFLKGVELELMNNDVELQESPFNYIGFNNCVLDIQDSKVYEFSPTDFILISKLGIDYYPMNSFEFNSANVEVINKFFHKASCGNPKLERFLYLLILVCSCRANTFNTAFVLTGNNRNEDDGRREIIEIIDRINGNSVSHENLRQLANSKSFLELYGKTCNICEEVEHPNISYMDNIRKLILGKELKASDKFKFSPCATLLINVKEILDFGNALFGLKDYFKIIPFNAKRPISKSITDNLFTPANLLYIVLKGITIYNQVLRTGKGKLPVVDVIENATDNYFNDNNSVLTYCKENPINGIICKATYYFDYEQYCVDNNLKRVSRANFGIEVKKLGYEPKRIAFKKDRVQCYMEPDFNLEKCRADYLKYWNKESNSKLEDKDIIYRNLVNFINGYEEEDVEDIENGTFGLGNGKEVDFDFGT